MHQRTLKIIAIIIRCLQFFCSIIVLGISIFVVTVYPNAFEPLLSVAVSVIILLYIFIGLFIHSYVPVVVSLVIEVILTILALCSFGVEAYGWGLGGCTYTYVYYGETYSTTVNGCILGKVTVAFSCFTMLLFFLSLIIVGVYGLHATKQRHGNVMHRNLGRGLLYSQLELDYTVHYVGEQNSPAFIPTSNEKVTHTQPPTYPIPATYDPHVPPAPHSQYSQSHSAPPPAHPPHSDYHESSNSFISQPQSVSTHGFAPHQPVPESQLENPSITNSNQHLQNTGRQNVPVDQFGNPIHY